MLLSETEERGRRFKLALRAGIPLLLLISLVVYAIFFQNKDISLTLENKFLMAAIVFITIYFIYFLIELSVKETLIDHTTQGFNQKAFIKKMEKHKSGSLILIIVNNLGILNENYSLDQINNLLYALVHNLNQFLSENGHNDAIIGRLYGAEFIIALKEENEDAKKIIEKFIEEYKTIHDIEIDYKFSLVSHVGENFEEVIHQLRSVIFVEQKSDAKGKEKALFKDSKEITEMEKSIISSIKDEKLLLSFRPLLNNKSDEIDIYEISTKLKPNDSNDILPRVYLPIINRLGLGRDYDFVLFKHIVDLLPIVDDKISFTFNLSPFSLRDKTFQDKFFAYLEESKVNPSRLIIELYERKTHHDLSSYLATLNKFRTKGIRIAIDNFGSSNASMEYMKHFKFDLVQFDRDYVSKLDDTNTYTMLESMVKMSRDLNIITVAKWVDKEKQKEKLKGLGIDYLQGFGIGKPITENKLIDTYN